jgi:large subunit ribosomal protein L4
MELREIKMTSVQILDLKGNKVSELKLSDEVFAVQPHVGAVHTALVRQLANARSGSANTKTRAEVRGGGAKPWRQKGTGRARAGSKRSPLWAGGGVIFGPKPRDYSFAMPRKMRLVAIKSALSEQRDNIIVVKDFNDLKEAKTKEAVQVLKNLEISNRKLLIVLDYASEPSSRFALAARNLANVKVIHVNNLNVKDLLHAKSVLTTEGAIEIMTNWLKSSPKADEGKVAKRTKTSAVAKPTPVKDSTTATEGKTKEHKLEAIQSKAGVTAVTEAGSKEHKSEATPSKPDVTQSSKVTEKPTQTATAKSAHKQSAEVETKTTKPAETKVVAGKKVESKAASPKTTKEKESTPAKHAKAEESKSEKKAKPKEEAKSKPKSKSTKK